jgi:hypothetical protein
VEKKKKSKEKAGCLVAHTYNPSYSRGWDQEDHDSKPDQGNSLTEPISKTPSMKKGWWSGSSNRIPA